MLRKETELTKDGVNKLVVLDPDFQPGQFFVTIIYEGKQPSGSPFANFEKAAAKFDETVAQCVAAGWRVISRRT